MEPRSYVGGGYFAHLGLESFTLVAGSNFDLFLLKLSIAERAEVPTIRCSPSW